MLADHYLDLSHLTPNETAYSGLETHFPKDSPDPTSR